MKTLFLVRHAKSSKDDPSLPDRERPLNDRGMHDAPKMGQRLAERDVKIDLIVSSPATRALSTAELFAKQLDYKSKDIVIDERLYESSPDKLLKVINEFGEKPRRLMLFGHNPEFTALAQRLSSKVMEMPTCAVAEFEFDIRSWSEVAKRAPRKVTLYSPKD